MQSSAVQFETSVDFKRATNFLCDKVKAAHTPNQPPQKWANKLLYVKTGHRNTEIIILKKQTLQRTFDILMWDIPSQCPPPRMKDEADILALLYEIYDVRRFN